MCNSLIHDDIHDIFIYVIDVYKLYYDWESTKSSPKVLLTPLSTAPLVEKKRALNFLNLKNNVNPDSISKLCDVMRSIAGYPSYIG